LEDIRQAAEPPRCGAMGTGTATYYVPKLMEDVLGFKLNVITGYPGAPEIDLAIEKGEMHCRGGTVEAIFKVLVQSGTERDPRLPDSPTIWEIMDKEKLPESSKRFASVILAAGFFGRPIVGPPGMAPDRLKILRESYLKTMTDPDFSGEAKKQRWELTPVSGEKLEARAKDVIAQSPEVIERMKKLLEN
jgi:hypothetical protein